MVGLELARLTGTSLVPYGRVLDKEAIKKLCSLDDNTKLEGFAKGTGRQLCSYLDSIQHGDNNLRFLRLSADYCRRRPSPEIVKYLCKLVNISQSFYICISMEQWLQTVVELQNQDLPVVEIHSNVVLRQAYLQRFEAERATCPGNGCFGGFSQASAFDELGALLFELSTNCALAKHLKTRAKVYCGVVRFWYVEEEDVETDRRIGGKSSKGVVCKVFWREGIFAKKVFEGGHTPNIPSQCPSFVTEIEVAFAVTHPNIVHFFGYTIWKSEESFKYSLYIELLEEDHQSHLQSRDGDFLSFLDVLHILLQVAEAMEHLHLKNFVQGDLKPGNILLSHLSMLHSDDKFYLVKVTDFGDTERVDPVSGAVEDFKSGISSTCYTAPEVLKCRDREAPPHRCPQKLDVYSYMIVAYQVLTGATCNEIRDGTVQDIKNLELTPNYPC